jgi:hypothetical protein
MPSRGNADVFAVGPEDALLALWCVVFARGTCMIFRNFRQFPQIQKEEFFYPNTCVIPYSMRLYFAKHPLSFSPAVREGMGEDIPAARGGVGRKV